MNNDIDITSRSWFNVFNNPEQHGYEGMTPEEILEKMAEIWIEAHPHGSCALAYWPAPIFCTNQNVSF